LIKIIIPTYQHIQFIFVLAHFPNFIIGCLYLHARTVHRDRRYLPRLIVLRIRYQVKVKNNHYAFLSSSICTLAPCLQLLRNKKSSLAGHSKEPGPRKLGTYEIGRKVLGRYLLRIQVRHRKQFKFAHYQKTHSSSA